jgi:hypothetical protein
MRGGRLAEKCNAGDINVLDLWFGGSFNFGDDPAKRVSLESRDALDV